MLIHIFGCFLEGIFGSKTARRSAGVIQMSANSQGPLAQIVPEVGMLGLPFLFEDLPSVWEVLDGEVGEMIDQKAQNAGLKVLTFWDNGIRHVSHVSKNVPTRVNPNRPPGVLSILCNLGPIEL